MEWAAEADGAGEVEDMVAGDVEGTTVEVAKVAVDG